MTGANENSTVRAKSDTMNREVFLKKDSTPLTVVSESYVSE